MSSVVSVKLHVARLAPDPSTKSSGVRSWRAALCGFGIILSFVKPFTLMDTVARRALSLLTAVPSSSDGLTVPSADRCFGAYRPSAGRVECTVVGEPKSKGSRPMHTIATGHVCRGRRPCEVTLSINLPQA